MPPKNQSKEKGSRKERAKNSALVGAAIGLVIIGVSNTDITDGATSGKTHVTAEPNQRAEGGSIFCSDPKPVETVNVTASQIVNYDTSAEIGKLPNIKKLSDINKIEFAYNHDVIQNPQEAWDFRDAATEYFGHSVATVSAHAGIAATGQITVFKCE